MPDDIDFVLGIRPVAALTHLLPWEGKRADLLARMRRFVKADKTALKQCGEQFDKLYSDEERSDHRADWLIQAAALVRQWEMAEREKLCPIIDAAKKELADESAPVEPDARHLLEDSLAMGEKWLALLQHLRARLLKLAAERRAAAGEILRARPIKSEIDHAALSREFIARFPKIRAALAK